MQSPSQPKPVAIARTDPTYPGDFPYNPQFPYPEYGDRPLSTARNPAYEGVRECFRLLGYDRENFGTPAWNPLGGLVRPGQHVFIKPNLVAHEYRTSSGRSGDLFSVITHPSVVRAVADYVAIALHGQGEITIGDNPSIDADFAKICERTGLDQFAAFYPKTFGVSCRVLDLRPRKTDNLAYYGFKSRTVPQPGDPAGSSVLNLGKKSLFFGMNPLLFRGVFTKRWETIRHHHGDTHEYCLSNSILNADVYISIPKLKTHHKVGATLNIKGLVGANANKNYLIHWRIGFPSFGGDEYPSFGRLSDQIVLTTRHLLLDLLPESWFLRLRKAFRNTRLGIFFHDTKCVSFNMTRGSWEGNDTCWRMAADLYNVFVKDMAGWRRNQGREMRFFSVVDGLLAGERDGPFYPDEKRAGVILAGEDLLSVDCVAARLMDFRVSAVPYIKELLKEAGRTDADIPVVTEDWPVQNFFAPGVKYLNFVPPSGWHRLAERDLLPDPMPPTSPHSRE